MSKVYCKYCGDYNVNLRFLTSAKCRKNPHSDYHEPYEGEEKSRYYCKYCGDYNVNLRFLTSGKCRKNPHSDYHEPER